MSNEKAHKNKLLVLEQASLKAHFILNEQATKVNEVLTIREHPAVMLGMGALRVRK